VPGGWTVTGELQGWQFRLEVLATGLQISASAPGGDPAVWGSHDDAGHSHATTATALLAFSCSSMNLFHDLPPLAASPAKPKLTPDERRAREADRLSSIRLQMAIGQELEERGINDPHAIASALGIPAREADKLLTRRQWREDDVARLEAAAARLGVHVPGP
jgi:hypothetical protein